jgi:RNA polymerase sigma factor (sigma-70 family)
MCEDAPVSKWIGAVQQGENPDAEQGLWEVYFARIQSLAKRKLGDHQDGEDIALSAMKSFFHRARDGQFPDLKDRTELWPLLVQTAIWKIHNLRRHRFAAKRDVRRAISFEWLQENQPTLEVAEQVVEAGNALLESLTDDKLRIVAKLKMDGFTNSEIAERIGRVEKTVEWRLRQIRKQLQAKLENGHD